MVFTDEGAKIRRLGEITNMRRLEREVSRVWGKKITPPDLAGIIFCFRGFKVPLPHMEAGVGLIMSSSLFLCKGPLGKAGRIC
jgi:hypothetical protein